MLYYFRPSLLKFYSTRIKEPFVFIKNLRRKLETSSLFWNFLSARALERDLNRCKSDEAIYG